MNACLPLVAATCCGYCNRPLTLHPAGHWQCRRCAPLLADVTDAASWMRFQRDAAKDVV